MTSGWDKGKCFGSVKGLMSIGLLVGDMMLSEAGLPRGIPGM